MVEPEAIRSSGIRQLHVYWESKRVDGALPMKAAIDPSEIKPLLPYITIVEIHQAPLRLHFRLVGTEVVRSAAVDFTDCWVPDGRWGDEVESMLLSVYQTIVDRRVPLYGVDDLVWLDGRRHRYEWARFPLSNDGATVTHTIGFVDHRHVVWD